MSSRTLRHTRLLVSVRSAAEARDALAGGADLIDVKEPARGPMGRADNSIIHEVIASVAERVPVSVALGELVDWKGAHVPAGADYLKWGLANLSGSVRNHLQGLKRQSLSGRPVVVAYADHERAHSPDAQQIAELACELRFTALLIDTAIKDGSTLMDWIDTPALARIRYALASAGVELALAGSLGLSEIGILAPLSPDWFAVRGAACDGGRNGSVSSARVQQLQQVISEIGIRSDAG